MRQRVYVQFTVDKNVTFSRGAFASGFAVTTVDSDGNVLRRQYDDVATVEREIGSLLHICKSFRRYEKDEAEKKHSREVERLGKMAMDHGVEGIEEVEVGEDG